jgi:hypothetical protein
LDENHGLSQAFNPLSPVSGSCSLENRLIHQIGASGSLDLPSNLFTGFAGPLAGLSVLPQVRRPLPRVRCYHGFAGSYHGFAGLLPRVRTVLPQVCRELPRLYGVSTTGSRSATTGSNGAATGLPGATTGSWGWCKASGWVVQGFGFFL